MDGLTASLEAADPFWIDNWDAGDWLRTEAAAAANALSESPQDAMAVALKATTTIDKAAILATALLWIILNIPMPPFLSAIFLKFMLTSFATDPFAAAFYSGDHLSVLRD
jgi:hypothetical protein